MRHSIHLLKRLFTDTSGVTLVEYGIAIGLAVTVGTAGFLLLADAITGQLAAASAEMTN